MDYDKATKEELIAEIQRQEKLKRLLVVAIIRHYRKTKTDNDKNMQGLHEAIQQE